MKEHRVGVILNGVTGRMGTNQHLDRSILAIIKQGGIRINENEVIMPDPILVGRNENKLRKLCERFGLEKFTTDVDSAMADPEYPVYFDALTTNLRVANVKKAIAAGKHIYIEKPVATNLTDAMELYNLAKEAGVKNGVVQDKLWLPGLRKLKYLLDTDFFGDLVAVRGEFGYWVFDGKDQPCQRPSWNYRKSDGGGMMLDMFAHWRYVIDNLFGDIDRLVAHGCVHLTERYDEQGKAYKADADDAAYGIFLLKSGLPIQFNSSWAVRVRRDDLLTLQVDGTKGSAVVGLRKCWVQSDACTPKPVWNPDVDPIIDYYADWNEVPDNIPYENAFKCQWELFLRHVVLDEPFQWDLLEGAKGVQLAELGQKSWQEKCWVEVEEP